MADLGIHEFGHLLLRAWVPQLLEAMAGNGLQTAAPPGFALYFLLRPPVGRTRDLAAAGLCLGWCASTLQDASIYIADAPYQELPLLHEGSIHDWAYILGPEQLDALGSAHLFAWSVYRTGECVWPAGAGLCLFTLTTAVRRRAKG